MREESRFGVLALLVGTVVMLLLLVAIARYPVLMLTGREYNAVFANVAGLSNGNEVRYGGVLVGTITGLELNPDRPDRITVRFRVRGKTPVRTDTRASITQVGLLGQPFLALRPGSSTAGPLLPGSTVPSEETMSFQDAANRLAAFFDRADSLISGAERLARTSPWERVDRTLSKMETLVENTATGSERVLDQLEISMRQMNQVLLRTEEAVATVESTLRTAGPGVEQAQREALATLRELHSLVADVRLALESGGGVDHVVRNMAQASENIARLTARIERDPSSLLQRRALPEKQAGPAVHD